MTKFLSLTLISLFAFSSFSEKLEWRLDPNHTKAHFKVIHLGITPVRGYIGGAKGTVVGDDNDLTTIQINATLDPSTLDSGITKRDNHLKSKDFLDIEKYPTITFESTKVNLLDKKKKSLKDGAKIKSIEGKLTIHGITKKVTLEVENLTQQIKNPANNWTRGLTVNTKINRKDFGLMWNRLIEGIAVAGEEVVITIDIEILRPAQDAKKKEDEKNTKSVPKKTP